MPHTLVHADNHMFFYAMYSLIQYYTWSQLIPTKVTLLIVFVCFCQTEVCLFEVWDIPWQGTSSLLSQKCQPKGQSLFSHLSFHLKQMFENSLDFFFFCNICMKNKAGCTDLHFSVLMVEWTMMLSMYWISIQLNLNRKRPMRRQKHLRGSLKRYNYDVTNEWREKVQ